MPRFAPVAGIDVLEELQFQGHLGDYHLWLAHEVLKAPVRWKRLAHAIHSSSPLAIIIMDNSLIELGYPLPDEELIAATLLVEANLLVLPDKLGDAEATAEMSRKSAYSILDKAKSYVGVPGGFNFLGVVQGSDGIQMFKCAQDLQALPYMEAFSIPRVTTSLIGSRFYITDKIQDWFKKPIHLLGFSDSIPDDVATCQLPRVMGIDSAVPIRMGANGYRINGNHSAGKRTPDYFEWPKESVSERIIHNLKTYREWIR